MSPPWFERSKADNHRLFSELDSLLRALDRFSIIELHPISQKPQHEKNFHNELLTLGYGVTRCLFIIESIIPETKRNEYYFLKFASSRLNKPSSANRVLQTGDPREQSAFTLYESLINANSVISDIAKSHETAYSGLKGITDLICSNIRDNEHFNPFSKSNDAAYDSIKIKSIAKTVKSIEDSDSKKAVSLIYIHLFRMLRFLDNAVARSLEVPELYRAVLMLVLVRSEIEELRKVMDKSLSYFGDPGLAMLLNSLSYQFSMETKRVFNQELKDIFDKKSLKHLRGKTENSHGILKNLTEQAVLQVTRHFNPKLLDEEIFEGIATRKSQSIALRYDMFVLIRMLSEFEARARDESQREILLANVIEFMHGYENASFRYLRYEDYDSFSGLFKAINTDYKKGVDFDEISSKMHKLSVLSQTTIKHIDNREELRGIPLDIEKAIAVVRQYLPEH